MQLTTWIFMTFLINIFTTTKASTGDNSQFYRNCMYQCLNDRCENAREFKENPPLDLRLLFWTCKEDCSYSCMWKTVDIFTSRGLSVPQFHGKWPFIRFFGIQEPASVIFSILNFYEHAKYYLKFKKEIRSSSPLFFVWTWFTTICLNGWFWSAVFHARDRDFTEVMDYSCAFSIVLTLLYCLLIRISYDGKVVNKSFLLITCIYLATFYSHMTHLWSGRIDYGYNMQFNIIIGFVTFVITMIWWYRNNRKLSHVYLVGWFTILSVIVTLLEVADFRPIFWTFDAHSLWHASTVPLVKMLYRFINLDCIYLRRQYLKLEAEGL